MAIENGKLKLKCLEKESGVDYSYPISKAEGILFSDSTQPGNRCNTVKDAFKEIKDGLGEESSGGSGIKKNTITAAKIANNAVTTSKIKDGNITRDKIANGAINGDKIEDNSIPSSKLQSGFQGATFIGSTTNGSGTAIPNKDISQYSFLILGLERLINSSSTEGEKKGVLLSTLLIPVNMIPDSCIAQIPKTSFDSSYLPNYSQDSLDVVPMTFQTSYIDTQSNGSNLYGGEALVTFYKLNNDERTFAAIAGYVKRNPFGSSTGGSRKVLYGIK